MRGDATELKWNDRDLQACKYVVQHYCDPLHRQVVIQAGGCYGVFAKWLAGEFKYVYTFEPDPALFTALVANVQEHNVVKLQAAIGRERKRLVYTYLPDRPNKPSKHPGMTRADPGNDGFIPTMKIDDLGLRACDLIYLDTEGDEYYALQGAQATLLLYKPVVVCEINSSTEERGLTRYQIFAFMREAGYQEKERINSDVVFVPGGGT
jgi:FkbM family methyltransferase